MKFLKSHTGAMAAAAVVIVLSVLLGSHRSLAVERNKVEALFYPTQESAFSIATDLQDCAAIAANLQSLGARYLPAPDLAALESSRSMLSDWQGVQNAYSAYRRLTEEAERVITLLEACELSEKDADYVRGFRADLAARADTIARSDYNQRVDEFNSEVLGSFPANILGRITFVEKAEAFR